MSNHHKPMYPPAIKITRSTGVRDDADLLLVRSLALKKVISERNQTNVPRERRYVYDLRTMQLLGLSLKADAALKRQGVYKRVNRAKLNAISQEIDLTLRHLKRG